MFTRVRAEYGGDFDDHVLDQYRLFIETEERLVSRRQEENRFFLSVNALLVTVISVLVRQNVSDQKAAAGIALLSVAGLILCYAWWGIINSYKKLNAAKFSIIDQFERQLPARMFGAEWEAAQANNYTPFTHIERQVPFVFGLLFLVALVVGGLGLLGLLHSG